MTPKGDAYCEGLLRTPIALPPTMVVSVKQDQAESIIFAAGRTASLTWCDDGREAAHVRLRSMKLPAFALDASDKGKFEWRTDLIAKWQPDWRNIGAMVTRETAVAGRNYKLLLPARSGFGYSSSYSFVVQSRNPLHLTLALLEPLESTGRPQVVGVTLANGPVKNTWTTTIPFARMKEGAYRVTFEESTEQAGNTTEPIYILHKACSSR